MDFTKSIIPGYANEVPAEVTRKPEKKKKLTKAEKKALRLQKQIEFRKLEIRSDLKRELELSRQTASKLKIEYDVFCRNIKIEELRKELTAWVDKAQNVFVEKNLQIEFQLKYIEDIETMQQRSFKQQLEVFQHVLDIYEALIENSKRMYASIASDCLEDFEIMLDERRAVEASNLEVLERVMYGTNFYCENEMKEDYKMFVENRNDLVNTEIEKREIRRDAIVRRMKGMRKHLLEFVNKLYADKADTQNFEHFERLLERQNIFEIRTKRLSAIENRCLREFGDLQREFLHDEISAQTRSSEIITEYNYFMEVRKAIERKIDLDREITFNKMKKMSNEGYFVIKNLKKIRDHGELLLSMCATALKYETQAERTVTWGNVPPLPPLDKEECKKYFETLQRLNIITLDMNKHIDLTDEEIMTEINMMHQFWRRHGMLMSQIVALEEEKQKLLARKEKYVSFVKSLSSSVDHVNIQKALSIIHVPTEEKKSCPDYDYESDYD